MVSERRRLALIAFDSRPLHALDRVVRHGVALAQVLEQGGEGGQAVTQRLAAQTAAGQVVAPGDHVRAGHLPKAPPAG